MAETISWLHLTDLHFGLDNQSWLWPRFKHDLFKDLEKLAVNTGGWDLVFFTGDFTQSGKKEEFDKLNVELEQLWKVLSKNGRTPLLCKVPGNHDLVRPDRSAVTKAISEWWWKDSSLRVQFWKEPNCEYRRAINSYFENYTNWASHLKVPSIPCVQGILPGDFSAVFQKGKIKIGIIGLNSTSLQIASGDFKGKLDIHVSQINAVCDGDPEQWLRNNTINVLLTHQPPGWLSSDSLSHYRQEIYPPGRFFAQFCGHEHNSELVETKEAGDSTRRIRQAPAIFGLEYWDDVDPKKRFHGYTAGQFIFESNGALEKFWPRIAVARRSGGLNLSPDHSYSLKEGDLVPTPFEYQDDPKEVERLQSVEQEISEAEPSQKANGVEAFNPLQETLDVPLAQEKLASCSRFTANAGPQHHFVRLDEQSQFENDLRKIRCVWTIADWGVGKEGFLSSVFERFKTDAAYHNVFHIRCDDASDVDAIEALFPQQFGMPLQIFCGNAASLEGFFLIFEGVHSSICIGESALRFQRLLNAILDYCPKCRLIITSRVKPEKPVFPLLELNPLESPDVRVYLSKHPDAPQELQEPEAIERIYEASEGLPMHIDRILRELKVASLTAVLESDFAGSSGLAPMPEIAPRALIDAVASLSKSQDNSSKRSFRLLKVLSILPYGETVEMLKHFLPTEPFFNNNALELVNLDLLDTISITQFSPTISGTNNILSIDAPKILKIPRQVRDYVRTIITEEEKLEIVHSGLEKYFGRKWREGKIKLRAVLPEYKDYLSSGAGNEFAIIHHFMGLSRNGSKPEDVSRALKLGIYYCHHLESLARYRDLCAVAGALIALIDREDFPLEWAQLTSMLASGMRLGTSKDEEALALQREALIAGGDLLDKEDRLSIWIEIALGEEWLGHKDEAVAAAEKIKELSDANSYSHMQAMVVIASCTLEGEERTRKLLSYEKRARKAGHREIADNILLKLSFQEQSTATAVAQYNKVLENAPFGYNVVRAIIAKAEEIQRGENPSSLSETDRLMLSRAYTYLHTQRFGGLFDRCHRVLWRDLEANGDTSKLLRLFRHTSFIWRIRGQEDNEEEYLKRLNSTELIKEPKAAIGVVVEITYFMKRLRIVVVNSMETLKSIGT